MSRADEPTRRIQGTSATLDELDIDARVANALRYAGVRLVSELEELSDEELLDFWGFGEKSLPATKEALAEFARRRA